MKDERFIQSVVRTVPQETPFQKTSISARVFVVRASAAVEAAAKESRYAPARATRTVWAIRAVPRRTRWRQPSAGRSAVSRPLPIRSTTTASAASAVSHVQPPSVAGFSRYVRPKAYDADSKLGFASATPAVPASSQSMRKSSTSATVLPEITELSPPFAVR